MTVTRLFYFIIILSSSSFLAQETAPKKTLPTAEEIEAEKKRMEKMYEKAAINVIGDNKDSLKKIPGSATLVEKKFLEETQPLDAMEVLRRVPGASTRFMDSAGLTPNIGFRGVSNEESRKTLILEDGVLTSLSPYGQPESYYSPQIDRMSRVEIVKGSGSILFGPSTIGGIVNFVTRKPPAKNTFSTRTMGGENGYFSSLNQFGGTSGKTGYDISYLHKHGDGYRDYNHFNVNEANLKLVHTLNEKHTFTFKLSVHEQKARATYLGLTEGLYWKNQRINPAQFDLKDLNRTSAVLGHEYTLNENNRIITKVYATGAQRNWQRQDYAYNNYNQYGTASIPPTDTYQTYAPAPVGNRPGDVLYMRTGAPMRNQGFGTLGIETKLESSFSLGFTKHEVDLGVRAHGEQNKINFKQQPSFLQYPFIREGIPFSQQDRVIRAYALYLQDRISLTDRFKVIPGLRYENISQGVYTKRRKATAKDVREKRAGAEGDTIFVDQGGESYVKILLPGFGVTYDINKDFIWFAGVHKSFSPPTFGTSISPYGQDYRLGAETATNYETGIRGDITKYLNIETAVYMMYFRDQIIDTSEVSSETGTRPVNTGKSSHKGIENSVTFDLGKFMKWNVEVPFDFIYSHINAKNETYEKYPHIIDQNSNIQFISRPLVLLDQNGRIVNPDTNGKALPYVPENVYTFAGTVRGKEGYYIRAEYQYIGMQYGSLSSYRNLKSPANPYPSVNGVSYDFVWNTKDQTPDGNTGVIPAYGLVNASLGYRHPEKKWSVFITGKNLQDRHYISGRLPQGIMPGPTRQINIGFSMEF